MAITNGYATLKQYKQRFFEGDTGDEEDDVFLEPIIEAVSREIDVICGRRFYAATETRYFTALRTHYVSVYDLLTVTTLKTDADGDRTYENTWATTDYDLMPFNATLNGGPYTFIEITPNGSYAFPTINKGIEIAGSFGYSSTTPTMIQEACCLGAHRMVKRLSTPLGVSASAALGQLQVRVSELASDPDFMGYLKTFIRYT